MQSNIVRIYNRLNIKTSRAIECEIRYPTLSLIFRLCFAWNSFYFILSIVRFWRHPFKIEYVWIVSLSLKNIFSQSFSQIHPAGTYRRVTKRGGALSAQASFETHRRAKRGSTTVPESDVEKRVTRIISPATCRSQRRSERDGMTSSRTDRGYLGSCNTPVPGYLNVRMHHYRTKRITRR